MTGRLGKLSICLTVTLAATALGPVPAHAAIPRGTVECGVPITQSVRVKNNLICTGDGIVIGAPNITVDLAGHRVSGDAGAGDLGIDNTAGHDGVTVTNGVVSGFETGVSLAFAAQNTIAKLLVDDTTADGIVLFAATNNIVRGNRIYGSGEDGIDLGLNAFSSTQNLVTGNVVGSSAENGIHLAAGAAFNRVVGNTVLANLGHGVHVEASNNRLIGNVARANDDFGLYVEGASNTLLRDNRAWANDEGIALDTASTNRLEGNNATGNADTGIRVSADSTSNVVVENVTHENGQFGINAGNATTTVSKNKAHRNGFISGVANNNGLGIFAQAGAQGGNNAAKDNDDDAQCSPGLCPSVVPSVPFELIGCFNGTAIDHSIVLRHPLVCTGDGLRIGANGITLDLNGHRIGGDGDVGDAGVENFSAFDDVTVKNGVISDFSTGVQLTGEDNVVSGLLVRSSTANGIVALAGSGHAITRNIALSNAVHGIDLFGTTSIIVSSNEAVHNGDDGIAIRGNSTTNKVKTNTVRANGDTGISINPDGDDVVTNGRIVGNTVQGNDQDGIFIDDESTGNRFLRNKVRGNQDDGILLASAAGNTVAENVVAANGSEGILSGLASVIVENLVFENGGDGIKTTDAGTKISRNRALRNGFIDTSVTPPADNSGFGVFATAGALGGNNVAKGNDNNAQQCQPTSLC